MGVRSRGSTETMATAPSLVLVHTNSCQGRASSCAPQFSFGGTQPTAAMSSGRRCRVSPSRRSAAEWRRPASRGRSRHGLSPPCAKIPCNSADAASGVLSPGRFACAWSTAMCADGVGAAGSHKGYSVNRESQQGLHRAYRPCVRLGCLHESRRRYETPSQRLAIAPAIY
jgi:hypothetical protein